MMHLLSRNARHQALAIATLLSLGACAHAPPAPVTRARAIELTATVQALDQQSRMVSLRSADGRVATVYAGPEVRNLDQVKIGDQVLVSFYEAIGAEVTTPERATQGVQEEAAAIRAAKGARPAGAIAESLTTTVEIESVDTSLNTVTFRRADGLTRVVAIEDPSAQAFIRRLKRGDLVQVTYMEAVAVSVRPVARTGSR